MAAAAYFDQIQKIYIAFYQRPADPAGLRYWASKADDAGGDLGQIINAFAASTEANTLYGAIDASTIGGVIDSLYLALFDRPPEAAGRQFYIDSFAAGTFTPASIALAVLVGAQERDGTAIDHKLQVANEFTQQVDGRPLSDSNFGDGSGLNASYAGSGAEAAARAILAGVTSDPATVLTPAQVTSTLQADIAQPGDPILDGNTGGGGGDTGGGGGGGPPPSPTFTATVVDGVVTFSGTATGTIEISVDSNGTATFVLGDITATVASIADKAIQLASGQTLALSAADVGDLAGVALKGAGTIKATEPLSIAQLTALQSDSAWTGTLAYTAVTDTAAHLAANAGGFVKNAINITVTDTIAIADLTAIDALTTGTVSVQFLEDTVANLYPQGVLSAYVTAGVQVNLLDAANITQLMEIFSVVGTGNLSFTEIADTAPHLLSFFENGTAGLPVGTVVTVAGNNAGALSMQEVRDLKLITTDDSWTYSLEDKAENLVIFDPMGNGNSASPAIQPGINVTITDAASVAQIALIDSANGAGTLSYSLTDTAQNLAAATATVAGATDIAVSDTATIAQINTLLSIKGPNAGTLTYSLSDTAANLLNPQATQVIEGASAITLAGGNADALTLEQVATLRGLTADDNWSYSLSDTLANLQAQGAATLISGATGVTVTGSGGQGLTVDEVTALVSQLPGGVWTYSLTDSADKLLELAPNAALITSATSVSVTGNAAGTLTLANVTALLARTTVDDWSYSLEDTAPKLLTASVAMTGGATSVSVTGNAAGTLTLANVTALRALTAVDDWTYSLQDSPASLALDSLGIVDGATAINLNSSATVAQIVSITGKASANTPLTYSILDTRTNIGSASDPLVSGASSILVSDTATIAQLAAIDARTEAPVRGYKVTDTTAHIFTQAGLDYLSKSSHVTVTDAAGIGHIMALWDKLDSSLGGKLTVTAISDTARNLLDAKAAGFGFSDITVTVLGNAASDIAVAEVALLRAITTNDNWTYSLVDSAANLRANLPTLFGATAIAVKNASIVALEIVGGYDTAIPVTAKEVIDSASMLFYGGTLSAYVVLGTDVEVTDAISIAQLQAIRTRIGDDAELDIDDISDTAANLLAHLLAYAQAHPDDAEDFNDATVTLTDALTVAQAAELLPLMAYSDWEYRLADTLANLQNPSAADVVSDASSYALTDARSALDNLTPEQMAFVRGASNAADYDFDAPTLTSVTGGGTQVVLTFSEAIQAGAGDIVIKTVTGDSTVATLAVGAAQVNGKTLTLTLPTALDLGTAYYIEVAQGVVQDTAGNDFAGITSAEAAAGFTAASVFDLILISEGAGKATYRLEGDGTVTVTGSYDPANQTSNYTFTPEQGAPKSLSFAGQLKLQVDASLTLTGTAFALSGMPISGAGTVAITDLHSSLGANLLAITTTVVTANFAAGAYNSETLENYAELGKAKITVSSGTLNVGNAAMGTATFEVAAGAGLKGTGTQLSGVTATGEGSVTASNLTTATDLSGITTTAVNALIESNINLSSNAQLGTVTDYMVNKNYTVTLNAAQLDGAVVSGQGSVTVLGSAGAQTLNIQTTGTNTITAGAGADVVTLDDGKDKVMIQGGTLGSSSDSTPTAYDTIHGFSLAQDTIALPTKTIWAPIGPVALGNGGPLITMITISKGMMLFNDPSVNLQTKIDGLLYALGANKAAVAFVDGGNTYVLYGDSMQGTQDSDIVVCLSGVVATSLATATSAGALVLA